MKNTKIHRKFAMMITVLLCMISCFLFAGCVEDSVESQIETVLETENETVVETEEETETVAETVVETEEETETETETETESETEETTLVEETSSEEEIVYDHFSLTMLDVGNGLSVVIDADGHFLLFDGGGRDTSSKVVAYLQEKADATLDYVVASHYDEDHISGIVGVLNTCKVGTVLRPDYETDTDIYKSFTEHLGTNGADTVFPNVGDTFQLGSALVTVLAPASYTADIENDRSIAILVQYNKTKFLITGDAETDSEAFMVDTWGDALSSDLYVVGHHGSSTSTSDAFLTAVSPSVAFISSGEYNNYGHPTKETLEKLKSADISIFRTDKQGDVTVYSDGTNLTFSVEPCDDYSPGSFMNPAEESTSEESHVLSYIANTNTMKFHKTSCKEAEKIKTKNRWDVECDRQDLINRGFSPCKKCNP